MNQFPAPLQDVITAYIFLTKKLNPPPPRSVVIGRGSAGDNLANCSFPVHRASDAGCGSTAYFTPPRPGLAVHSLLLCPSSRHLVNVRARDLISLHGPRRCGPCMPTRCRDAVTKMQCVISSCKATDLLEWGTNTREFTSKIGTHRYQTAKLLGQSKFLKENCGSPGARHLRKWAMAQATLKRQPPMEIEAGAGGVAIRISRRNIDRREDSTHFLV